MTLNTKPPMEQTVHEMSPPPAATALPPSSPQPQRFRLPLLAIGFLVVGSGAYLLGRGTAAAPRSAPPVSQAAETEGGQKDAAGVITLEPEAVKTAGIRVELARSVAARDTLTVPGTVEVSPNRRAKITPPVPGKVVRLLAGVGDRVRSGQPLAVLDSVEVAEGNAAVRQAEAGVQQAQAQIQTAGARVRQTRTRQESAAAALGRQRELARTGAFSQPSLQTAQNELADAQAELTQAQTALGAARTVLQRTERLFKEQLVARAEWEQAQTEERQSQTRLERAEKRVAIARQAAEREQRVFQGGLLTRQVVQTAEAEVRTARGEVQQAQQEEQAARTALRGALTSLAGARANLRAREGSGHTGGGGGAGRITLFAPIGGTVTSRGATLGEAVERTSEMFIIEDLDTVTVEANVPEADVARVRVGQPATVTAASYPNVRFSGVVRSLGSRVDEKTRTLPVRCLVRNPGGRLRPEMFARVTLTLSGSASRTVVAVPASAIAENGDERFVFVQARSGGYEKRPVRVGQTLGERAEILSGVKPGEPIVVAGVFVLKSESLKDELKGDED